MPTVTGPDPKHRRGAAVTEHLLEVTLELIAERGPSLSIDDVAATADVNKTTVYRRWPDIGALIADAVKAHASKAIPIESTGDVRADLLRLTADIADNLRSPVGRALRAAAHVEGIEPLRHAFWTERLTIASELLSPEASTTDRPSSPLADQPVTADAIMEWLVAPLHFRIDERGLPVDDAYLAALVDHFLRGIDID